MEKKQLDLSNMPHQLSLRERGLLLLEGVQEVDRFDEQSIVMDTTMGELTVNGQNLHIQQLSLQDGVLSIEGKVDALVYRDTKKHSGFWGRLLQ